MLAAFVPAASAAVAPAVQITSPANNAVVSYPLLAISFTVSGQSPGDTVSCFSGTSEHPGCSSPWIPPGGDGTTTISIVLKNSTGVTIADTAIHVTITDTPVEPPAVDPPAGEPPVGEQPGTGPGGNDPDYVPAVIPPEIRGWPKSAKVGKTIKLKLNCPDGCKLALALKLGGKSVKGIKPVSAKPGRESASIKLPSGVVKKIRAAQKKSKKTKAQLTITPSSNTKTGRSRKITLKPS